MNINYGSIFKNLIHARYTINLLVISLRHFLNPTQNAALTSVRSESIFASYQMMNEDTDLFCVNYVDISSSLMCDLSIRLHKIALWKENLCICSIYIEI